MRTYEHSCIIDMQLNIKLAWKLPFFHNVAAATDSYMLSAHFTYNYINQLTFLSGSSHREPIGVSENKTLKFNWSLQTQASYGVPHSKKLINVWQANICTVIKIGVEIWVTHFILYSTLEVANGKRPQHTQCGATLGALKYITLVIIIVQIWMKYHFIAKDYYK